VKKKKRGREVKHVGGEGIEKKKDELEQVDILVVLVHPLKLRRILQLVVPPEDAARLLVHSRLRLSKQLDKLLLRQDFAKRLRVAENGSTYQLKLVGAGRPATATEEGFAAGL
jgi:hypothetical protein